MMDTLIADQEVDQISTNSSDALQGLFEELHSRPFPVLSAPVSVSQIAVLNQGRDVDQEWKHLSDLCHRYSVNPPERGTNCFYQDFGEFSFRWERHTEFSTYTLITSPLSSEPFGKPAIQLLPRNWVEVLWRNPVSAVHVEILNQPEHPVMPDNLRTVFEGQRLIGSNIQGASAQYWTAFRLHTDGYGRVLVYNRELNECQLGRLLRSILELETYRNMALMALPLAREIIPQVREMEEALAETVERIPVIKGLDDEKAALRELSQIAARTGRIISNSTYRFAATKAYYELVVNRLGELQETELEGLQTLSDFLDRRLEPAHKTCEAVGARMMDLSHRIDRASDLLRTRVDLAIQTQNQQLLKSMNHRSKLSLLIQRSVEGLSVVVITYYVLSLIRLLLGAGKRLPVQFNPDIVTAAMMPVVFGLVWWGLRSLKKRIDKESKEIDQSDV